MSHSIEKLVSKLITFTMFGLVMISTALLFYLLTLRLGDVAKESQTYDRYISCVLSVAPEDRDQKKVDNCWLEVQKDTGYEVKRYDK